METIREEIDPFEGIDDPTVRVQMQQEMREEEATIEHAAWTLLDLQARDVSW